LIMSHLRSSTSNHMQQFDLESIAKKQYWQPLQQSD
jgi:hypothetical protein